MSSSLGRWAARVVAVVVAAGLAACGGSSHTVVVPGGSTAGSSASKIRVTIPIGVAPPASTASLTPSYFSPKAQSLTVVFFPVGSDIPAGQVTLANLTPNQTVCTTSTAGTVCNITTNLPAGNYSCTVETYSGSNGHGPVLSIQEYVPLTIAQNGAITTPPWMLWGVPQSVVATPLLTPALRQSGTTITAYSLSRVVFAVTALDQAGAQLVGPGLPTWSVTSSNPGFVVTQPTAQAPNTFTVAPEGGGPTTTQINLTATYPQSAINFCRIVGANCSAAALTLNALNVTADDWLTFAHDYQRTGLEAQRTGISTSTAPNLALRWKIQVPNATGITSNPAVYDGNVIVVTSSPAVVYDLSAIDGSVLWQFSLGGAGSAKPPTIDPHAGAHGLVFVGNRTFTGSGAISPSTLYALNLNDGSVAWQTTVNALTRGSEVVANGEVYIPTAGGDPPQCLNAGVQQVNEATGTLGWTWYVNNLTNPGGGGAVWGAIAYDGAHLIFGTGNVCQNSGNQPGVVQTADGAAALDLNGNLLWSYVAWAQAATNYLQLDYDTGSGVMIRNLGRSNETATFVNKNSSMYTFNVGDLPSALLQQQLVFNPNFGYGQYASPTTDGDNVVVQTGAYANSTTTAMRRTARDPARTRLAPDFLAPKGNKRPSKIIAGYHSYLEAFNASGQSMWSFEMQSIMQGYAAITNGVVVAPGDSAIVALAMTGNGTPIWTYPTAGAIDSSPAVVPSGIYIGDLNGNVYAFAPPFATTTPASKNRAAAP
jgi:outer membrane protein assembly factor BamB